MTTLKLTDVVNRLIEGQTLAANALQGVLASDQDPFGYPLALTTVSSGS